MGESFESMHIKINSIEINKSIKIPSESSDFHLSFDLKNKRLFIDLPTGDKRKRYFFLIPFENINEFKYKSNSKLLTINIMNRQGELYFSSNNVDFNKFHGTRRYIREVGLSDETFKFDNEDMDNDYVNFFNSSTILVRLVRNETVRILKASRLIDLAKLKSNKEINDNLSKRKSTEIEENKEDKNNKKQKVLFTNRYLCFKKNEDQFTNKALSTIQLPCNHSKEFDPIIQDLFDVQYICPKDHCDNHYEYSFCDKKFYLSNSYIHCVHLNKCIAIIECPDCFKAQI